MPLNPILGVGKDPASITPEFIANFTDQVFTNGTVDFTLNPGGDRFLINTYLLSIVLTGGTFSGDENITVRVIKGGKTIYTQFVRVTDLTAAATRVVVQDSNTLAGLILENQETAVLRIVVDNLGGGENLVMTGAFTIRGQYIL